MLLRLFCRGVTLFRCSGGFSDGHMLKKTRLLKKYIFIIVVFDFKDEQSVHHCIAASWFQVAMVAKEIKASDCATTEQR